MANKKTSINWYFLIIGSLLLFFLISRNKTPQPDTALQKITITLSKDIVNVKGRRSPIDYKMWTKQYPNQFNILDGSISKNQHKKIANLKAGQVVEFMIAETDYIALGKANKAITIKGISINENQLMAPPEFYKNRLLYNKRLFVFLTFGAIMFLLNGLLRITDKLNYAVIGLFIGTLLVMRILGFGFY